MKILVKKWTKKEKRDMAHEVTTLYIYLKKKFKDLPTVLFIIESLQKAIHTDVAVRKIKSITKDGWDLTKEEHRLQLARRVVEGMESSHINLLIFRDDDEIWYQYHLAMYIKKPTYIIALKEEKKAMLRIKLGGLVRQIEFVDDFDKENLEKAMEKMRPLIEKERKR